MSKAKKSAVEPVAQPLPWCADVLFDPKVQASKRLPPGLQRHHVVLEGEPRKDRRGKVIAPQCGGTWVRAEPPAWVK